MNWPKDELVPIPLSNSNIKTNNDGKGDPWKWNYWIHLNDTYFCIFSFSICKYQKHGYLILYRIDATPESNERLGRLVNHCQRNGNLTPRSHVLDGQPGVIFIDAKLMKPGEQLCYDCGDYSKSSIREHEWVLSSMLEQNG